MDSEKIGEFIDEILLEGALIVPSANNVFQWFEMRMKELKNLVENISGS